ncbi:uncharacterized protein LOC123704641 isoform X2 [Colias croceus]|uniref:uncharacterized protein LOC123704641 isoform X2 n=1 Tax=Colias crocea TaxID=72248 RepID=UPI001E27CCA0|nr:uncharacterized protein LOC123704641 isoform X2 [Colias croceus]
MVTARAKRRKMNTIEVQSSKPNDADKGQDIFSSLIEDFVIPENRMQSTAEELDDIQEFEIGVESNVLTKSLFRIEGRRIVDFNHLFDQIKTLSDHNPGLGCSISNMQIIREKLIGLESVIHFQCNMCNQKFQINSCETSPDESNDMTINHAALTGAMLIGCGRTNLNELLTAMDLPKLNQKTYNKCHSDVSNWWAVAAETSMKEAAKEEGELAIESGEIIDGIPAIVVVADACWSKRSYRNNYAAASGAAAIIGFKTGKVLFMEVKNKYCIVCARSVSKNQSPPIHQCTRNHLGSS